MEEELQCYTVMVPNRGNECNRAFHEVIDLEKGVHFLGTENVGDNWCGYRVGVDPHDDPVDRLFQLAFRVGFSCGVKLTSKDK